MKRLSCRDAGFNCDHVMEGNTDDDVMRKAREHGAKAHNIKDVSPDMEKQLRGRIRSA